MTKEMFKLTVKEANEREIPASEFIGKVLESKISEDSKNEKIDYVNTVVARMHYFFQNLKIQKNGVVQKKREMYSKY